MQKPARTARIALAIDPVAGAFITLCDEVIAQGQRTIPPAAFNALRATLQEQPPAPPGLAGNQSQPLRRRQQPDRPGTGNNQWPGVSNGSARRIVLPAWAGPVEEPELTIDGVAMEV